MYITTGPRIAAIENYYTAAAAKTDIEVTSVDKYNNPVGKYSEEFSMNFPISNIIFSLYIDKKLYSLPESNFRYLYSFM